MKWAGILFLILAISMVGQYLKNGMEQRVKALERIKILLDVLCSQLEYSQAPVCSLLENLSMRGEVSKLGFVQECKNKCEIGETFPMAWRMSVNSCKALNCLKPCDRDLILSVGEIIGATDAECQINSLKLQNSLVNANLENARQTNDKYGKACLSLSILAGIAVGIVLM